jgi:hypothetical protein
MTLTAFEAHDVLSVGIEIPGAAGGLRDPLKLDPVEMALESTCVVILKLSVSKVRFDPIKDTDGGLTRVHVMNVVEAAFADEGAVESILAETRRRVEEQKKLDDEAKGTPQLPLDEAASTKPHRKTAEERIAEDAARPFDPSLVPSGVA